MAGIEERVRIFLDSWAEVKEQLEELTTTAAVAIPEEEDEGKG